jgi:hypothetical protein
VYPGAEKGAEALRPHRGGKSMVITIIVTILIVEMLKKSVFYSRNKLQPHNLWFIHNLCPGLGSKYPWLEIGNTQCQAKPTRF